MPDKVILDAKYKIVEEVSSESALKDMSHFVETICDRDGNRIVKSAHIIYPGKLSQTFGKIGFLGLLPSEGTADFERDVEQLISKYLE